MNKVLLIIEQWMNVNKLKMNAEKTKYMTVRGLKKEQRGEIILRCSDGIQIEIVEVMKYYIYSIYTYTLIFFSVFGREHNGKTKFYRNSNPRIV